MGKEVKGITVELDGNLTNITKSINDANKACNSFGRELGQVDKLLKLDPGNITLVKQKQELLTQSITQTKAKLEEMQAAQGQVEAKFKAGEIDGGQYRNFQRELEATKQSLSKLQDEKKSVFVIGAAFQGVKDKAQELNSKLAPIEAGLKKVGSAAKTITDAGIKTVSTAVDAAGKGLKIYAATAAAAGTAVAALTVKAAGAADDINTLSAQTGLSAEQIQKFQFATDVIDVPLETLTGSMAKLTKNMSSAQGGTGSAAEAFKTLGVSVTDSNGQLRNNQDVMNDAITALGGIENSTQRDALAMKIFGKSAQDLNPLILGGADALKVLGNSAQSNGLILSQEALDHLNKFQDSLDIMKASAGQAGNVLAGVFAGGLTSSVDVINQFLPQVTGSIAGLFSGKNMEATQTQLTSDLVTGANQIITGFGAQLPMFLAGFNAVIISVVTAISAVLPSAIKTILPVLLKGFTNLIQGLLPQVPVLLPVIIGAAVTLFMGLLNGLNKITPQLLSMLPALIQNVSGILIKNFPLIITAGIRLLTSLITGITKSIPQLVNSVISLIPVITDALLNNLPALIQAGIQLIVALAVGLPKAIPAIIRAIPSIIKAIIKGFASVNWGDVGSQVIQGIGQGLISGVGEIGNMIKRAAGGLLSSIKGAMGIHSPSRLFRDEVGRYLALGLGEGFVGQMDTVKKQMAQAIPSTFSTAVDMTASGAANYDGDGARSAPVTYQIYQTNQSPQALSPSEIARNTRDLMRQVALKTR